MELEIGGRVGYRHRYGVRGIAMGRIVISDLDDEVIETLRRRAESHGVTLEEELRALVVREARPRKAELLASADRIRAANRPPPPGQRWPTAEEMIREDRDGRAELLAEIDRIRAPTPLLPPSAEAVPGWVLIREDRDTR
jgi:plasmid stability protein